MIGMFEVDQAISQLDPVMTALQAQTNSLSGADATTWPGVYQGWQDLKSGWSNVDHWYDAGAATALAPSVMGKIQSYQASAAVYAAKVKAGGGQAPIMPDVNPGPAQQPPDPSNPGGGASSTSIPGAIVTVAVIGGVAYGLHALLTVFSFGRKLTGK